MKIWIALLAVASFPANAMELTGNFVQGGLVVGQTTPDAVVTLDDTPVDVADNGAFVVGFGRDAKPRSVVTVQQPGGAPDIHVLAIKAQTYNVQRIDGLAPGKVTPRPEDSARIQSDNAKIWDVRAMMTGTARFLSGFEWPVKGPLSGVFGSQRILNGIPKRSHNGVDIAAPKGAVITAPADGVVVLAEQDMFYTGKTVMIDHGLGLTTVYAHMDDISVIAGEVLKQGDALGRVGQSGRVTGPHLHWGMTWKGVYLDPQQATGPMPRGAWSSTPAKH